MLRNDLQPKLCERRIAGAIARDALKERREPTALRSLLPGTDR